MPDLRWMVFTGAAFLGPPLAERARRQAQTLATLPVAAVSDPLPSLSIVVPARNESANLKRLLPSLQATRYPGSMEIIVVDDQSSDDTVAVAERYGVHVISNKHLPADWLGKPNACHLGAAAATGQWLLFTDADTVHAVHGPASAVKYALDQNLDGLSAFLHQQMSGLMERLALTTAFAGLFAGLQASTPLLNGQFILLKREVYQASDGFAAVADQSVEDVALAHHLQNEGFHVPCLWAPTAATVRMYSDASSLWHGMTRLGSGSLPWSGSGSLLTVLYVTAVMAPLLAALGWLRGRLPRWWLLLSWSLASLSHLIWAGRLGSRRWAPLAPFGGLIVQTAALFGIVGGLLGKRIYWKGRHV